MIVGMHHNVQIIPIPAFKDNYIWLIKDCRNVAIVDPGDAKPVIDYLKSNDLYLKAGKIINQDFRSNPVIPFSFQLGLNIKLYK